MWAVKTDTACPVKCAHGVILCLFFADYRAPFTHVLQGCHTCIWWMLMPLYLFGSCKSVSILLTARHMTEYTNNTIMHIFKRFRKKTFLSWIQCNFSGTLSLIQMPQCKWGNKEHSTMCILHGKQNANLQWARPDSPWLCSIAMGAVRTAQHCGPRSLLVLS